jgi:hypothetical protein
MPVVSVFTEDRIMQVKGSKSPLNFSAAIKKLLARSISINLSMIVPSDDNMNPVPIFYGKHV